MKIALTATPSPAPGAPFILRGSAADAFETAEKMGYDGVELHILHAADVDREEVKKLCIDNNMGVPTLGTGMAVGIDGLSFTDPDAEIRRRAVERVNEHTDLAAYLGSAVTIGFIAGKTGKDPKRREYGIECLASVCKYAQPLGVTILIEPLNRYESDYINTTEDGLAVIEEIGAPNLKLLSDTFHMNIEEASIPASIRKAGKHVGHVHLADTNRQAPGHGHLQIEEILEALKEIGYDKYISFEVLPLPDPMTAAEDAIRRIK